jgi:hypothetical protein
MDKIELAKYSDRRSELPALTKKYLHAVPGVTEQMREDIIRLNPDDLTALRMNHRIELEQATKLGDKQRKMLAELRVAEFVDYCSSTPLNVEGKSEAAYLGRRQMEEKLEMVADGKLVTGQLAPSAVLARRMDTLETASAKLGEVAVSKYGRDTARPSWKP